MVTQGVAPFKSRCYIKLTVYLEIIKMYTSNCDFTKETGATLTRMDLDDKNY